MIRNKPFRNACKEAYSFLENRPS